MKKKTYFFLGFLVALIILGFVTTSFSTGTSKNNVTKSVAQNANLSDKDLIYQTVDNFNSAFKNGDWDAMVNCFTGKIQTQFKLYDSVIGKIIGKIASHFTGGILGGDDTKISPLWSLSTTTNYSLRIELDSVFIDAAKRTAKAEATYIETISLVDGKNTSKTAIKMLFEKADNDWKIADYYPC